jgi:hypothetical protein
VDGNRTASCEVSVSGGTSYDVFLAGNFGLLKNGQRDQAIATHGSSLHSVAVDIIGGVHASGADPSGRAVHFKDGVPTLLPVHASSMDSCGNDVAVTTDGRVYVAGYDDNPSQDRLAKLWLDGVDYPLEEASDYPWTDAVSVTTHNGKVYTFVVLQDQAGLLGPRNTWYGMVWEDKEMRRGFGIGNFDPGVTYLESIAIASNGRIYCACGALGLIVMDVNDDIIFQTPILNNGYIYSAFASGIDWYAAGWQDGPVYFKNGSKYLLPKTAPANEAVATDIFVVGGNVYVTGFEFRADSQIHPMLWKNSVLQPVEGLGSFRDSQPISIFVAQDNN